MQVLILAAGEGKRMRPLTNNLPKPLIEVNGICMLDRILNHLAQINKVNKIVVNGNYLADKIENHLEKISNSKIIFSKENEKLETGGGLVQAMNFFDKNKPILIINGDIIWQNFDLDKFINNFDEKNTDILLALKEKELFFGYEGKGDFNLDEKGNISKDKINKNVYLGIQIINPKILNKIDLPNPPFSLNHFFLDKNIEVKGIKVAGDFFHIGTPNSLEEFEKNNLTLTKTQIKKNGY